MTSLEHGESHHSDASEWDELEARSLVFAEMDGPQERLRPKRSAGSRFRWHQVGLLSILGVCVFMFYLKEDILTMLMVDNEYENEKTVKDRIGHLKMKFTKAKTEFHTRLEEDYGEYKDDIFGKATVKDAFVGPSELSNKRLQRRMLIKILEAQLLRGQQINFNFVIGGHSAAAGHGNLFNQTYGYVLEQAARPIFEALGITFYGKNYAMGGMGSGPQSSMCMSATYGPDIDVLSWDFGMTDGSRNKDLYNLWAQKAGSHPTKPSIISFGSTAARAIHEEVEKVGMSAFDARFVGVQPPQIFNQHFPDSDDPKVNATALPRAIKNFLCAGHKEEGELCGDKLIKFDTKDTCPKIGYQVSWHNGWKDHMLKGLMTAAFLVENLIEALDQLNIRPYIEGEVEEVVANDDEEEDDDAVKPAISKAYLMYLYSLEANDKKIFLSSETPSVPYFAGDLEEHHDLFLRAKTFCRTAFLPSYSRYNGLGTESPQEMEYIGGGRTTYKDEGVKHDQLPAAQTDAEPLLTYNFRNNRDICEFAEIDFKDYYNIRNEDDWVHTVIPNDSEFEAFSESDDEERVGIVTLCISPFDWNRFPDNHVNMTEMLAGNETTIMVNEVPVTNATDIGGCFALSHGGGDYVFPSKDDLGPGRYEIKFHVLRRGGQMYLSAFFVI